MGATEMGATEMGWPPRCGTGPGTAENSGLRGEIFGTARQSRLKSVCFLPDSRAGMAMKKSGIRGEALAFTQGIQGFAETAPRSGDELARGLLWESCSPRRATLRGTKDRCAALSAVGD